MSLILLLYLMMMMMISSFCAGSESRSLLYSAAPAQIPQRKGEKNKNRTAVRESMRTVTHILSAWSKKKRMEQKRVQRQQKRVQRAEEG